MTTKQEIPSESIQQVVEKLYQRNNNMILTSPIVGIPESYLYSYKESADPNKIITLTEMHAINTQKRMEDFKDLSFYIETVLSLDLCNQLLQRKFPKKNLEYMKEILENNRFNFLVGMQRTYRHRYQVGKILDAFLNYIDGIYTWEWILLDFDKSIPNALEIQKCMNQFIKIGPSKVILSAYDTVLENKEMYQDFQVIHFPEIIPFEQLKQEALHILNQLYGIWVHKHAIEQILHSSDLEQIYQRNDCSPRNFIAGIIKFYNVFQNIDSINCKIDETELLTNIEEYIICAINECDQKKKSKLYI